MIRIKNIVKQIVFFFSKYDSQRLAHYLDNTDTYKVEGTKKNIEKALVEDAKFNRDSD